ncbi:coiled-coil protein [Cystoisospora suis]|uniref:Coiled-coil protein n=1 Tax=Cystoisospora suis TaxID=483139 RepID=A0A2C6LEW5_9APIC|nr:coiled-coil protein [Cystoisospora suis]
MEGQLDAGHPHWVPRKERQERFQIDCEDELIWCDWSVGQESAKRLVFKNVGVEHQTIFYRLPHNAAFALPFPEPFRLPPGMSKSFLVTFLPTSPRSTVEQLEVVAERGSFVIFLKAIVKKAEVSIPKCLNFGYAPVNDKTEMPFFVHNTGALPVEVVWKHCPPFSVFPLSAPVGIGAKQMFTARFEPQAPMVYDGKVICSLVCEKKNASALCITENVDGALTLEKTNSFAGGDGTETRPLEMKGIGKLPHLHITGKTNVTLDFGTTPAGVPASRTVVLENTSPVKACFEVVRRHCGHADVPPKVSSTVTTSARSGVIPPGKTFPLVFKLQSAVVSEDIYHEFQVLTRSGAPTTVKVKAFIEPTELILTPNSINFGNIPAGRKVRGLHRTQLMLTPDIVKFRSGEVHKTISLTNTSEDKTFPATPAGAVSSKQFFVRNMTEIPLRAAIRLSGERATDYRLAQEVYSLLPLEEKGVECQFVPTEIGASQANVLVKSEPLAHADSIKTSDESIPLRGDEPREDREAGIVLPSCLPFCNPESRDLQVVEFIVHAHVVNPVVEILDIRSLNRAIAPSRLWAMINAEKINEHFAQEVQESDLRFLDAEGLDARETALRHIASFALDLGCAPAEVKQSVFLVTFHNPGDVPVDLKLESPGDLRLANPPLWANEETLGSSFGIEAQEQEKAIKVEPSRLRLGQDEFAGVVFAIKHEEAGNSNIPIVLSVNRGRAAVLNVKWTTLRTEAPVLVTRGPVQDLHDVKLGSLPGPVQAIELANFGGESCSWSIEPNGSAHAVNGHEVLKIDPTQGTLFPSESTHVHLVFTPLAAENYEFPLTINIRKKAHGEGAEDFPCQSELTIRSKGVTSDLALHSRRPCLPPFLATEAVVPVQTLASLSAEKISLLRSPPRCLVHRFLILRNCDPKRTLHFCWDKQGLFPRAGVLAIHPATGVLNPNGYRIVEFIFRFSETALDIDGEIVCLVTWTAPLNKVWVFQTPPDLRESTSFEHGESHADGKICLSAKSTAFIVGTLIDMICDSIESEKTKELIVSLVEEPAPLLTDLVADVERGRTESVAGLCKSMGTPVSPATRQKPGHLEEASPCATKKTDRTAAKKTGHFVFRQDFENWSPLVMNFLDCLPNVGYAFEKGEGAQCSFADGNQTGSDEVEVFLARDRNLNVDVLPVVVSDIFRHLILDAIDETIRGQIWGLEIDVKAPSTIEATQLLY